MWWDDQRISQFTVMDNPRSDDINYFNLGRFYGPYGSLRTHLKLCDITAATITGRPDHKLHIHIYYDGQEALQEIRRVGAELKKMEVTLNPWSAVQIMEHGLGKKSRQIIVLLFSSMIDAVLVCGMITPSPIKKVTHAVR